MALYEKAASFSLGCSSGCESGWTMYLEHSCGRTYSKGAASDHVSEGEDDVEKIEQVEVEEEEEDLSMVSDASSGPPHFHEECCDKNGCFFSASSATLVMKNTSSKRRRVKTEDVAAKSSFLDDTASSHLFHCPKSYFDQAGNHSSTEDILDFSIGFSATHFQHYDIVQSFSSSAKPTPAKPGFKEESRRGKKIW